MIYENSENIYFNDNNNTFSVNKNEINSDIKYLGYVKDGESLLESLNFLRIIINERFTWLTQWMGR